MKRLANLAIIFAVLLATILGGLLYIARISFSEYHQYSYRGLNYYLMTPSELAAMTGLCKRKPDFTSRLISGVNSIDITSMRCRIEKKEIIRHLEQAGFVTSEAGQFKKGNMEVTLSTSYAGDEVVEVTLWIYPEG